MEQIEGNLKYSEQQINKHSPFYESIYTGFFGLVEFLGSLEFKKQKQH